MTIKIEQREYDRYFEVGYVDPQSERWVFILEVWKPGKLEGAHINIVATNLYDSEKAEILADACYAASELLDSLITGQISDD